MAQITTQTDLQEALKAGRPVVVDFSATWCGPCKRVAPIMEELATEYAGKADIFTCDVDDSEDLAAEFGIRSVPTILFFKGSETPVDKLVGAHPKQTFIEKIDALL